MTDETPNWILNTLWRTKKYLKTHPSLFFFKVTLIARDNFTDKMFCRITLLLITISSSHTAGPDGSNHSRAEVSTCCIKQSCPVPPRHLISQFSDCIGCNSTDAIRMGPLHGQVFSSLDLDKVIKLHKMYYIPYQSLQLQTVQLQSLIKYKISLESLS